MSASLEELAQRVMPTPLDARGRRVFTDDAIAAWAKALRDPTMTVETFEALFGVTPSRARMIALRRGVVLPSSRRHLVDR